MTNNRKRHTPEQVVRKLNQADRMLADGADVAAVCRELGVSEQTYYRWRNQYGGLKADDAKRLKELEKQNGTLKADSVADQDAGLRAWLRDYAKAHPRWGYRRAYHDARAEGWHVNHKKIQRLWREEGLRVPQRRRRKRIGTSTADTPKACAPNVVWGIDFQFDVDEAGRAIKIASIVDEHTRECIGGLVERSITADHLTDHLDDLVAVRGAPAVLRCDNGPEFISQVMADWAGTRTGLSYIPPGTPWLNGYVESFNSRLRDECLNINSFYSLLHAQVSISDWKVEYNTVRRHSTLGYLPPADYARNCTHETETDDSHTVRT